MTTLYFMRHAQSEANLKDILASRQDFELTEKGRKDAENIAAELKELTTISRVFSSPLARASQTAAFIADAFDVKLETEERIIEQELGRFAGKTYEELDSEPDYMHGRTQRWTWVPDGGGESYEMIADRLRPFFKDLDSCDDESVLFVTHAVTMRLIRATLEQTLPAYPYEIAKNGEIWKVEYDKCGAVHTIESIFLGESKSAVSRA